MAHCVGVYEFHIYPCRLCRILEKETCVMWLSMTLESQQKIKGQWLEWRALRKGICGLLSLFATAVTHETVIAKLHHCLF